MSDNKILSFYSGRDLKVLTLQESLESIIDEFVKTERVSLAAALGVLEVIKHNLLKNSGDK